MTNKLYIGALALTLILAGCVREKSPQAPEKPQTPQVLREVTPQMQAIVEFDEDMIGQIEADLDQGNFLRTKSTALNDVLLDLGVVQMERVFPDAGIFEERSRRFGMHRFYQVVMAEEQATKAVTELAGLPGILSAEPVREVSRRSYFDDPNMSKQWHLVNTKTPAADIHLQEVWERYTTGSSKVIVSVVDEAVDVTHPDLLANLWTDEEGHHGRNFVRGNYDLTIARPDVGHGAHVAGTISAVNNNGVGVASVAGGDYAGGIPGVRLMSCQIFAGNSQASETGSANAIKWGADHGAVISQNSWGYSADVNQDGRVSSSELESFKRQKISSVMKKAVDYFIAYAGCDKDGNQLPDSPMKGGLVLFACGNDNIDYDVYSSYEPIISVGATGAGGKKASYSCYGDYVDIAAPGGDGSYSVWSTLPTVLVRSGYGGSGWQGTSMACPHASGVAALLISYFGGPGFTAEACKEYLLNGAGEEVGDDKPIGRRLDALGAFEYGIAHGGAAGSHPPVITLEKTSVTLASDETVTIGVVASDPDGDLKEVTCDPGSQALTYDPAKGIATIVGKDAEDGKYKAVFTATDEGGSSASATLEYTISTNHAPIVELEMEEVTVAYDQTVQIKITVSDPDGDPISLSCSAGSKALKLDRDNGIITIVGSGATEGTYKATIAATDNGGLTTRATLIYTLLPNNQEPEITVDPTELTLKAGEIATARVRWSDPDGDPLTITCQPGSDAVEFNKETGEVSIIGRLAEAGSYKAIFLATDPSGAEAKAELFYTILENHPPVISIDKDQITLNLLESVTAELTWADEDGDDLVVTWKPGSDALNFEIPSVDENRGTITIRGNKAPAGTYKAVFTVSEYNDGLTASVELSYTIRENHAPVITVTPASITLRSADTAEAQVSWSDPDDWDQLAISCDPGSPALSFNPSTGKVTIQGSKAPGGTYAARFTATDLGGLETIATLDYVIQANHAPVVAKTIDSQLIKGIGQTLNLGLEGVFGDEDGEALALNARVSEGSDIVKVTLSGNTLVLSSAKAGLATVIVEAKDAAGESCSTSFQVAVKPSDNPVDVYPIPAQDYVYFQVDSLTDSPVSIVFYTATGTRCLQLETSGSVFKPIQVDITSLAPGRYTSVLEYNGQSIQNQIIVR